MQFRLVFNYVTQWHNYGRGEKRHLYPMTWEVKVSFCPSLLDMLTVEIFKCSKIKKRFYKFNI